MSERFPVKDGDSETQREIRGKETCGLDYKPMMS